MVQEIFMEVPAVQGMSQNFQNIAGVLADVNKELEECLRILNETAYTGRVGGEAVERYISTLQPIIHNLSEKSVEVSGDLAASARAYVNGDALGSTRFH